FISASATTSTEAGYLSGVTSAIQTQIDGKQATVTGAATTITSANLTTNRALISNGSGKVAISSVTDTELGYVSGVTSAIQTQIDTKLTTNLTSVAEGDIVYFNGIEWVNLARGTNGQALYSTATSIKWDTPTINGIPIGGTDGQVLTKQSGTDFDTDWESLTVSSITDLTATAAELNILDGATIDVTELNFLENASANIQDQLNNKMSGTLATDHIFKGVGGVATASTDLPTGITIGGAAIYRAGGADVSLADGGTGASLSDPGADRITFWDDSAGQVTWLEVGGGLSINDTTITGVELIDEDDMASDSDTKAPTQQSVKAYVDAQVGSAGAWQKVTIPVSSAEILALNTTPKRLIDNPGAGNGIIVDAVIFRKTGPTTAYATNTTMRVYLGSGATPVIDDVSDFLTESGARVQYSRSNSYGNTTVSGNHINLTVNGGNPTDGDGDIEVDVIYMIVDTAGI